jgi:anti-sigma regulatory factor (Ser/Thr protein kinase)
MTSDNDDLYWLLNQDQSAASQARALTWEALARLGLEVGLVDDGVAIVGELVANAVVHGRPPVELQGRPGSRGVKLLVIDRGTGKPMGRSASLNSSNGRGLLVVSAYSGAKWGTAAAPYRSIAKLDGKAVWAVLPRRPRQQDDLEPEPAARLLHRWLARRGLRDVASRPDGRIWLVSVAGGCTISCLPGKLAWRTDDNIDRVFSYRELPDVVDHLCRWSSVPGKQARRGPPVSPRTGGP